MGRFFVKLTDPVDNRVWYLQWSTVVDAPVTVGMSKNELLEFVGGEFGRDALTSWWSAAWQRLIDTGTSAAGAGSTTDVILVNRAGAGESCLSYAEIVDFYCRRQCHGNPIKGKHTHSGLNPVEHCRGVVEETQGGKVVSLQEVADLGAAAKNKRGRK